MIETTPAGAAAGTRIRPASAADYGAFARLAPELGPDWPVPEASFFSAEMVERTLVAERTGRIVGYLVGEAEGSRGFVHQLVSDPAVRRQGVARALLLDHAARLRARGCTRWQLNVEGENAAARALYRSVGLAPALRRSWVGTDRATVALLTAGEGIVAIDPAPSLDEAIARTFDFPPGAMRWFRSRGRPLAAIDRSGTIVGFCVHARAQELVRPLHLLRSDALAPLLAPLGAEGAITLALEDRVDPLVERLLAAGGTRTKEEFLYVGALDEEGMR